MGIFEIIGELVNPGPAGRMDFNAREYKLRQKFIPVRLVLSLIIIGLIEYWIRFHAGYPEDFSYVLKANIFLVIYLLLAFAVRIQPDYDNLGWVPFVINNPFRLSDNFNRFLVILTILFAPGKYISRSLVEFYRYCKRKSATK